MYDVFVCLSCSHTFFLYAVGFKVFTCNSNILHCRCFWPPKPVLFNSQRQSYKNACSHSYCRESQSKWMNTDHSLKKRQSLALVGRRQRLENAKVKDLVFIIQKNTSKISPFIPSSLVYCIYLTEAFCRIFPTMF